MTKSVASLNDKYTQANGRVYLSSNQALVRLPLDQARRDRAAGLKTAGYISGYRGSPLGVYDAALWGAQALLDEHDVRFMPGLNEELAATAIRGTQEIGWFGESRYDGVFGLWYGKGLGVDRACESLKLGNLEGSATKGGYLVVAGDDHGGKSSASAHQSEHTLITGFIPILYPSTTREILEFGIYGWALSRYSGLYVGMKCITDTLDLTASVELPNYHRPFVSPDWQLPLEGLSLRRGLQPLVQEENVVTRRLPAAAAFARANGIDGTPVDGDRRSLGIFTAGKAYLDVRQALADLGLDERRCRDLGVRVQKAGLIWPLEREAAIQFAVGHRAILVVEEKRPVMEEQLASILYGIPADVRPALMGKRDLKGEPLLSSIGELEAASVRTAIAHALKQAGIIDEGVERHWQGWREIEAAQMRAGGKRYRPAFFCSGCPHNTSTNIPDGSIAISAVGCHGLAAYVMPERRTMPPMQMGGDGMPWVGASIFVGMPHLFQNMGDGTYSHSGILAIRAAVAAKTNITFKILYNDAVAMTGGQPVEAQLTPVHVLRQLLAEGVSPVRLITDEPGNYAGVQLPSGVTVHHRDELDAVQRELRELPGASGIVYEQTCATEKRRRRKRGTHPDPDKRVFINQDVCEGCGDCSVQSNCVSVQPLETEFGRKRRIDQSTCNKDFSCIKGFCPSFVTVTGAKIATRAGADPKRLEPLLASLPEPVRRALGKEGFNLLVAGIGGTGVLTVGALLGMAAHLDGFGATVLDQTGMAQKGGAVTSHIRINSDPNAIYTSRLGVGTADVVLGCDMIVTSGPEVMKTVRAQSATIVLNEDVTPTGDFQTNRKLDLGEAEMEAAVAAGLNGGTLLKFAATKLATDLTGDSIATNILMVGYALQKGLLPVSKEAIEEAIRLNGSFVKGNLRTFALGRLIAHAPEALARELAAEPAAPALDTVESVIASRRRLLTAYQNESYADRYSGFVRQVEQTVAGKQLVGGELFVREVALTLARLMAYKDEYEVARLHADPLFWERLRTQFTGGFKVRFHLAPPILPGKDAAGRPRKREFGPWMLPVFRLLARLRRLRGTPFDPFGRTAERRMERSLIDEYCRLITGISADLEQCNLSAGIEIAEAANDVRGYGPVKHAAFDEYRKRLAGLLPAFNGGASSASAGQAVAVPAV
jgi:indolepyruvate ferredoxin oxidoreductase